MCVLYMKVLRLPNAPCTICFLSGVGFCCVHLAPVCVLGDCDILFCFGNTVLCVDSTGGPASHLLLHKHIENYCGDIILFKSVKKKNISSSQESIGNNSFLVTMNCNFFYTVCMNSFNLSKFNER